MYLFVVQHLTAYYFLNSVLSVGDVRLSVLAGRVNGSGVVVCPNDTQPLIFMCECTGLSCIWHLDPLITSSNAIEFILEDNPGHIISRNSLTAFLIKKTPQSNYYVYESQLFVPINVISGVSSQVVCENDGSVQSVISITTVGMSELLHVSQ